MLSQRNVWIMVIAGTAAGLFLNSILGAVLGSALAALTIHFNTFVSASVKGRKPTAVELLINLGFPVILLADIFVGSKHPMLHWAASGLLGAFIGHIVVGICVNVFGKRG